MKLQWTTRYPLVYSDIKSSNYFDFGGGRADYDDNNIKNKTFYVNRDPVKSSHLINKFHFNRDQFYVMRRILNSFCGNPVDKTIEFNCSWFLSFEENWFLEFCDSLIKMKKDILLIRQRSLQKNLGHLYISVSYPQLRRKLVYTPNDIHNNDNDLYHRVSNEEALGMLIGLQHKKFHYYWTLKQQKK